MVEATASGSFVVEVAALEATQAEATRAAPTPSMSHKIRARGWRGFRPVMVHPPLSEKCIQSFKLFQ